MKTLIEKGAWRSCLGLVALAAVPGCSAPPQRVATGVVIAHRGASGHLPEHTLEAYSAAFEMGADFLEPDLVMCRDGHLVCSHDLTVTKSSNAARLYPDRANEEGEVRIRDLLLSELQEINITDEKSGGSYRYVSFEEFLDLTQLLAARKGEMVGIIPELKAPEWHRSEGLPMETALMSRLAEAGYRRRSDPVILQCFERSSLYRLGVELDSPFPQVLCLGAEPTADDLVWAAEFCDGVAPPRAASATNSHVSVL